jgi:hypothetical protein
LYASSVHERRGFVVLTAVLGLATASCGCHGSTCGSTEAAHLVLPSTVEELSSATLTACRNEQCWSANLAEVGERPASERFIVPSQPDSPSDEVTLEVWAQPSSNEVSMELRFRLRNAELAKVGDVLSAVVSNAQKDELFSGTAEVRTFRTSNNACGTTECRSAEVQLATP